jgi:flagellar hook assembly protein FlgD
VLDIDEDEVIEILYNGPQASHIAVRIFDLQGRSVTTLYDGWCLGPQRATWDGKDDRGEDLPPGVYICQVQARARTGEATGDAAVPIVIGMKLQ